MDSNNITFEKLPEAVGFLISEMSELKNMFQEVTKKRTEQTKRTPINIDRVSEITGKAKSTIYALVRGREIPSYKAGKNLYFYEDELLAWINSGKRKTNSEIRKEDVDYKLKK